jgi:hypothetical protein
VRYHDLENTGRIESGFRVQVSLGLVLSSRPGKYGIRGVGVVRVQDLGRVAVRHQDLDGCTRLESRGLAMQCFGITRKIVESVMTQGEMESCGSRMKGLGSKTRIFKPVLECQKKPKKIEYRDHGLGVCVYLHVALCAECTTFQEWLCKVDTALVHVHPGLDIVERIAYAIERSEKVVIKQFLRVGANLQKLRREARGN